MMMIRSFATEQQTEDESSDKMLQHKNARMRKNHFSNFCNIGFGLAINEMYLFGVCYCGYGILLSTISYGTLTAITQLISQIQAPFANITSYLPRFYAMTASAERIMEIEDFINDSDKQAIDIDTVKKYYTDELRSFGLKNAEIQAFLLPTESSFNCKNAVACD